MNDKLTLELLEQVVYQGRKMEISEKAMDRVRRSYDFLERFSRAKNTNNLDTYAWILFRQERFAEAKIYIDQALTIELAKTDTVATDTVAVDSIDMDDIEEETDDNPQPSAVVLEHGGDIYAMTGDIERAVELWQQALLYTEDRQDILMQKIQKRKYIND